MPNVPAGFSLAEARRSAESRRILLGRRSPAESSRSYRPGSGHATGLSSPVRDTAATPKK